MFTKQGKTNIKYLLIVVILAAIVGGGTLYCQYTSVECKSPVDCKGKTHIMCVGEWDCIDNQCFWNCQTEEKQELEEATLGDETTDWQIYRSEKFGFEIRIPPTVKGTNRCFEKDGTEYDFLVPLKVFEDDKNSVVYIVPEYYYDADSKDGPTGATEQVGPCKKIEYNSLDSLAILPLSPYYPAGGSNPFLGRAIHIGNANNDIELIEFLSNAYNGECFIRSKELWVKQEGVYRVYLGGELIEPIEERLGYTCPLIGAEDIVLYAPAKGKVMALDMGQEGVFVDADWRYYDFDMIDSFRFK